MATLISSVSTLKARIREYQEQAQRMQTRMSHTRAWYALKTNKGWIFGPSKFVGYEDMDAKQYLEQERGTLDGRITEGVLQRWADLIEEGRPEYAELHHALNEFCARFGKKPSKLARISLVTNGDAAAQPSYQDDFVKLVVAVYNKFTPAQKSAFQNEVSRA
jgi:hypothetical protein